MRDSQRQKLYDAERRAFTGSEFDKPMSIKAFKTYVNQQVNTARFERLMTKDAVSECQSIADVTRIRIKADHDTLVRVGGNNTRATWTYGRLVMTLPAKGWRGSDPGSWARRRWVAIHELCHAIGHARGDKAGHGWQFAGAYLEMVRGAFGKAAHDRLRDEFKAGKVRYRPKRTLNLTPEQREERRARLAASRPTRKAKLTSKARKVEVVDSRNGRVLGKVWIKTPKGHALSEGSPVVGRSEFVRGRGGRYPEPPTLWHYR